MRHLALAFALATLPVSALAQPPGIVSATLAERATPFRTLAECEQSLVRPGQAQQTPAAGQDGPRGSWFNRTRGNLSRCEMIHGEPLIIVVPNGS